MTTIFVYGTLKKGHYNHTRFRQEGLGTFLGNATVKDMSLVMTNHVYPTAIPNKDGIIEGELWEVADQELLRTLRQMELGAGYEELEINTDNNVKATMWYSPDTSLNRFKKYSKFPVNETAQ